ncbi:MAG: sodium/solute symporter [FCB group bacterium]|nr:sodium/solute symporter [FCB group bacterium]
MNGIDWTVIAFYFILVFCVAYFASIRGQTKDRTSASYFLAGRNVGWFVIGASLFASNIGSEHLIGLAGTGAASGVAVGQFEVLASLILLILGWVFVPFYLKSGVYTMPEFLERRYSSGARWYLAIISVIGYVLTKISVTIAAGGIVFQTLMGVDFWTGALIVVIITGIYTVLGGLRAVLYTDMLQMFVLIGGAVTVTIAGLAKLGGIDAMLEIAPPDFFDMWLPASNPNFPWTGILFGAPILGVWYWCTDQFIVQRTLSARDETQARRGTIFGGFLKLLPVFIFVIPGVIAYCLAQSGAIHYDTPDQALPTLVSALLPAGLRGVVVAGLLAALMSSLSSVFNSCSTLITWDIYKKIKPDTSEKRLVLIGQLSTIVLVGFGLLWIPLMKHVSGQLYQYLQSVQAYISPPIAAVFLIGVMWKRVNAAGAITALIMGFILGMGRLIAELNKSDLSGWMLSYASVNFLHFAVILFVVSAAILIIVSLFKQAADDSKLRNLTFATLDTSESMTKNGKLSPQIVKDIMLSVLLVGGVILTWIIFS